MYKVYWTQILGDEFSEREDVRGHDLTDLSAALTFCEDLRTQRRNGAKIRHIVMSAENPNSVGEAGVADVKPGYDWKKRRQ